MENPLLDSYQEGESQELTEMFKTFWTKTSWWKTFQEQSDQATPSSMMQRDYRKEIFLCLICSISTARISSQAIKWHIADLEGTLPYSVKRKN